MVRLVVCGGRTWGEVPRLPRKPTPESAAIAAQQTRAVYVALAEINRATPIELLAQGGARGADRAAHTWAINARDNHGAKIRILIFGAWWSDGPRAGPERNTRMLEVAKPDLVLAFPGGRGTADCVSQARALGIEVREWTP